MPMRAFEDQPWYIQRTWAESSAERGKLLAASLFATFPPSPESILCLFVLFSLVPVLSCGPVVQHLLCEEQYVVDGWLSLLRRTYLCEEQYDHYGVGGSSFLSQANHTGGRCCAAGRRLPGVEHP